MGGTSKYDVAVVGGGSAGLSASYYLNLTLGTEIMPPTRPASRVRESFGHRPSIRKP